MSNEMDDMGKDKALDHEMVPSLVIIIPKYIGDVFHTMRIVRKVERTPGMIMA